MDRPTLPWQSFPRHCHAGGTLGLAEPTLATYLAQPGRSFVGLTPRSSSLLPLGQDRVWVLGHCHPQRGPSGTSSLWGAFQVASVLLKPPVKGLCCPSKE